MNTIKLNINSNNNLLAFSAGIDSTALFFLMIDNNINFDIAIVNYNQREQSKDEVIYATQLAHKYNKKCFISTYPKDEKFSEKSARDFRYDFFDQIMEKENYKSLLTAHQLNDKVEWFLMQLSKGAGLSELFGMEEKSIRKNYNLLKPLLNYSKQTLKDYLDNKNIKYFIDESNKDQKYKRNYFRHNFSDKLLSEFESGISKSFQYLQKDLNSLNKDIKIEKFEQLHIYKYNSDINLAIRIIDKDLKQRGIIISKATRDEIIKQKNIIVSHNIAISINDTNIYIAPTIKSNMDKKFKERCRVAKVPQNIRAYLSTLNDEILDSFFLYNSTSYLNYHD
ncbi:MAG: tRNA lysidine(34) synthetase TilS [Campylobacterota bacterium]|nr:tRNA lysidine(34) synthetase TilS [Campylobacterota bacterium]